MPWHLCSGQAWARGRGDGPQPPQRAMFCPRNGLSLPWIHSNLGTFRSEPARNSSFLPGVKWGGELVSFSSAASKSSPTHCSPFSAAHTSPLGQGQSKTPAISVSTPRAPRAHTGKITSHRGSDNCCCWSCRGGLG